MDDWKKLVLWAAQQEQDEKLARREHVRRTWQAWPMIAVATIPFGWLAFSTLNPVAATICTIAIFITAVLVALGMGDGHGHARRWRLASFPVRLIAAPFRALAAPRLCQSVPYPAGVKIQAPAIGPGLTAIRGCDACRMCPTQPS
jgi:hypothetical protein